MLRIPYLAAAICLGIAAPAGATTGRCTASYQIALSVDLDSKFSSGDTRVMVELRQGVVGNSEVAATRHFVGRNASVAFSGMCAGTYFIALGMGRSGDLD